MSVLGSVSQLYMFILLVLLFLGSGFALWSFINFILNRNKQNTGTTGKKPVLNQAGREALLHSSLNVQESESNAKNINQKMIGGGLHMNNNGWLKLAVFSFVGILVSVIVLGFVSTNNSSAMNTHQQHQQGNMNMQGGMNVNTSMGNMQMQGGMNGNMGMQNNGNVQQQLNQIQQQLNQIQQQLNNGGMSNMQQNGSGNMGGMGMMGGMMNGMMGGMGNMQNNSNMNNMQQNNNMNNMQQNSGSMSGMGMM